MTKSEVGKLGEEYAASHVRSCGFTVVQANYHSRYGEIDVIAENDKYIIFIEVKVRAKDSLVSGLEAITSAKMRKVFKTALCWMQENPTKLQPRFDVCEVITEKANEFTPIDLIYIKNAFGAEVYNESF